MNCCAFRLLFIICFFVCASPMLQLHIFSLPALLRAAHLIVGGSISVTGCLCGRQIDNNPIQWWAATAVEVANCNACWGRLRSIVISYNWLKRRRMRWIIEKIYLLITTFRCQPRWCDGHYHYYRSASSFVNSRSRVGMGYAKVQHVKVSALCCIVFFATSFSLFH